MYMNCQSIFWILVYYSSTTFKILSEVLPDLLYLIIYTYLIIYI